jgi:peptidyl-prolyl cis-trans isomerase D
MLKSFRGALKGFVAWIIVGLFIIAFAFVGVPALNNFGGDEAIRVGDTRFDPRSVEDEFTRRLERNRRETGEVLTRSEAVEAGLLRETLAYFTLRGLYQEEAETLGVTVTDEMIQNYLSADENLQNPETGKFDQVILQRLLQANRMSPSEFKRRIADELLQRQMDAALLMSFPGPETIAELVVLRQTEERAVSTAMLTADAAGEPSADELQSYYAANVARYSAPERRAYTLLTVSPETVADRISVPEEDVRRLYEARAASLGVAEQRSFVQGQFPSREAAEAALAQIEAGTPFAEAVRANGGTVASFTDEIEGNLADDVVAEAVFATDAPGVVGPVDGTFGVVLAEIGNITPGTDVSFEDAREELETELAEEIVNDEIDALYDEIQEAGDAGASLAEAARDVGLDVRQVGPVDADFIAEGGAIEADVPVAAHRAAFAQAANGLFEAIDLQQGGYAFVEVESIIPAAPIPFEDVRDAVARDYAQEERETGLAAAVARFQNLIGEGQSFEAAAEALGASAVARTLTPTLKPEDMSQALFADIYSAPIGEVVAGPVTPQGITVAQTTDITYGPNAQTDLMTQQVRQQLGQTLSRDYYQAYLVALEEEYSVRQNDAVLQQRFGAEE